MFGEEEEPQEMLSISLCDVRRNASSARSLFTLAAPAEMRASTGVRLLADVVSFVLTVDWEAATSASLHGAGSSVQVGRNMHFSMVH